MGPTRLLNPEERAARKQREVLEKDATEIQLEKILFGDQAGFLDSLNATAEVEEKALTRVEGEDAEHGSLSDGEQDEGMEEVPDEDLFFLDAGTTDLPQDVMEDLRTEEAETSEEHHSRKPLWYDTDDERITVSLASNTRLRKLRDTEDDDLVNGIEYIRRLRRQYERLHPTPEWVRYARKKRRLSHGANNDESDTDSDFSIDSPFTSAKPLAELLRSAGSLVRKDTLSPDEPTSALKLRPEVIDIQRLKDIASSGPSSIDVLQFHSTYPLLLTAGPSSTINLYHISPNSQTPNPLLTSLHVKGTPITSAAFALSSPPHSTPNTPVEDNQKVETKVYLSARRRYFHTWSLNSGTLNKISRPLYSNPTTNANSLTKKSRKNAELPTCETLQLSPDSQYAAITSNTGSTGGVIHILSTTTHQPICQCRIDSLNGIADLAFYNDSTGFSAVGKNGEVSEYNIPERRVVGRWTDEGAVGTTTLALGGVLKDPASAGSTSLGNNRYVAIGSTSGIVNIYDRRQIMTHFKSSSSAVGGGGGISAPAAAVEPGLAFRPKPLRVLDQLTTPISHLHFSGDAAGQMLVVASRWKKNALRLVHLPSATVYRNWPTDKTPLGRISSVAISPDGRYLVVGNEAGKVRLWQIRD